MVTLGVLVSMAAVIGVIAAHTYVGTVYRLPGVRKLTMEHVFNGTFWAAERRLAWVGEAGDGVFSIVEEGEIRLVDLERNETRVLVRLEDVLDVSKSLFGLWCWAYLGCRRTGGGWIFGIGSSRRIWSICCSKLIIARCVPKFTLYFMLNVNK